MKSRCKFRVVGVTDHGHDSKTVELSTQYDKSIPEDQQFSKYTPSGNMKISVSNPALDGFFTPGREFYVDLMPVDEQA